MILRENGRALPEALKSQIRAMAHAALDAYLTEDELWACCKVKVVYENHCELTFTVASSDVRDVRIKMGSWVQTWDGLEISL